MSRDIASGVGKSLTLAELGEVVRRLRASGRVVVHCHGLFDLLQPVHIERLEAARREGDVLVVTVIPDTHLGSGGERPVVPAELRASTLAALACVDHVAVAEQSKIAPSLRLVVPDVYAAAVDWLGSQSIAWDEEAERNAALLETGARLHLLPGTSGNDGEARPLAFSPAAEAFLCDFRRRHDAEGVIAQLRSLSRLKVLVIGDVIIDEYHYCRPYGMPQKAPVIAAQFLSAESHAGGVLAVANHLAGLCGRVHVVTCLGGLDPQEEFVRRHLRPNVTAELFVRADAPTTVKRRYLRKFLVQKLFEISFYNDEPLPPAVESLAAKYLEAVASDYDLVVVADYGQGLITRALIDVICRRSRYLAVNTQLNSINFGYHVITKYPRADYACVDEEESRMACRDRFGPVQELVKHLARELDCRTMTVTRGHHGSLTFQPGQPMAAVPVLSREVVDTIGAGDAYFAVSAPCASLVFSPEVTGFVGNVAGAVAVGIIGNQRPVEPEPMFALIRELLS